MAEAEARGRDGQQQLTAGVRVSCKAGLGDRGRLQQWGWHRQEAVKGPATARSMGKLSGVAVRLDGRGLAEVLVVKSAGAERQRTEG